MAALRRGPDVFVYRGHIEPGTPTEPASTRLRLAADTELRADELIPEPTAPARCILLGCDASGAAIGSEWTGVATGFVWAGATEVITTQWPVVDRPSQEQLDHELVETCLGKELVAGLSSWQHHKAVRWRNRPTIEAAPYQWANPVALRSRALFENG